MDKKDNVKYYNRLKILISLLLIMTLLCALKVFLKDSYAYYDGENEVSIINATIGFMGNANLPEKATDADFATQIYLQDQSDEKSYNLVNKILYMDLK